MQINNDKIVALVITTLFFASSLSCNKKGVSSEGKIDGANTPTITSTNLTITNHKIEGTDYRVKTPLMERFELVDSPYILFKKGVYMESYDDSTGNVESTIESDYARYDEKTKIWEARGNVKASSKDGKTLFTEQLFYDEKNKNVYSNVKTKLVNGDEVNIGLGFEADDKLENGVFKQPIGRFAIDTTKTIVADTLKTDTETENTNK